MQSPTSIIPIQDAVILRGQRAWSNIKSTAFEQRQLWKEVGEALLIGRQLHKADRAFSQWCYDQHFYDMKPGLRSDAMWLAQNWDEVYTTCNPGVSHPTHLRQEFRNAKAELLPAPDLLIETPSRLVAGIEVVAPIAKTVNKLAAMAERGEGQEKETARKYLAKKAKDLGMEAEELTELSMRKEERAALLSISGRKICGISDRPAARESPRSPLASLRSGIPTEMFKAA